MTPAAAAQAVKRCPKCETSKPVEAFARDRSRRDGLQPRCRECHAARHRERYAADPETHRQGSRDRRAANVEAERQRRRAYQAANVEGRRAYNAQRDPRHKKAHRVVRSAVERGDFAVGSCLFACEACSPPSDRRCNVEAHHTHGYEPEYHLAVVWLCPRHHKRLHADEDRLVGLALTVPADAPLPTLDTLARFEP